VKTYAAPVTPSNVTNLSGRKPADACTLPRCHFHSWPDPEVPVAGERVRFWGPIGKYSLGL